MRSDASQNPLRFTPSFFPEAFALCNNHRPVLQPTLATVASQMTKKERGQSLRVVFRFCSDITCHFWSKMGSVWGGNSGDKGGTGAESTHAFPWPKMRHAKDLHVAIMTRSTSRPFPHLESPPWSRRVCCYGPQISEQLQHPPTSSNRAISPCFTMF